jgi:hypothetical protein
LAHHFHGEAKTPSAQRNVLIHYEQTINKTVRAIEKHKSRHFIHTGPSEQGGDNKKKLFTEVKSCFFSCFEKVKSLFKTLMVLNL